MHIMELHGTLVIVRLISLFPGTSLRWSHPHQTQHHSNFLPQETKAILPANTNRKRRRVKGKAKDRTVVYHLPPIKRLFVLW